MKMNVKNLFKMVKKNKAVTIVVVYIILRMMAITILNYLARPSVPPPYYEGMTNTEKISQNTRNLKWLDKKMVDNKQVDEMKVNMKKLNEEVHKERKRHEKKVKELQKASKMKISGVK
tara:strand:+ start:3182 stop:3535 length:354 start_codon:yes stop_codon:yes gene_type:complete